MGLWIEVILVNEDKGHYFSTWEEEMPAETTGELFRMLRREYGRPSNKVSVDERVVGWTFEKRAKYEDSPDTYLQTAWVTVLDDPSPRSNAEDFYGVI